MVYRLYVCRFVQSLKPSIPSIDKQHTKLLSVIVFLNKVTYYIVPQFSFLIIRFIYPTKYEKSKSHFHFQLFRNSLLFIRKIRSTQYI